MSLREPWAIVLAGGEGTRLSQLTTDERGLVVPKQFCSLRGGRTLLGDALARARTVAPRRQTVVVVAAEHRRFWHGELTGLPSENVVVQPRNRGTAPGILLPLAHVLERDHEARVAVLPSDHYVRDESVVTASLDLALRSLAGDSSHTLALLGMTPESPETDYGWIVGEPGPDPLHPVAAFVEKPDPLVARQLFDSGGLWNSFLFAARGATLLELYALALPDLLASFGATFAHHPQRRAEALEGLYARIGTADFSRDVLERAVDRLCVLDVPPCGWTDLGTPRRLAECLRRLPRAKAPATRALGVDLEQRLAVLGR